ncbi:hypothetical protein HZS_3950 [Henneguya salminicola]|nr:hypothetical protein HZS_3950 [Henneguya salminicola]
MNSSNQEDKNSESRYVQCKISAISRESMLAICTHKDVTYRGVIIAEKESMALQGSISNLISFVENSTSVVLTEYNHPYQNGCKITHSHNTRSKNRIFKNIVKNSNAKKCLTVSKSPKNPRGRIKNGENKKQLFVVDLSARINDQLQSKLSYRSLPRACKNLNFDNQMTRLAVGICMCQANPLDKHLYLLV